MNIQEVLMETFGTKIERSKTMVSWTMKELATFTYAELRDLHKTCVYFAKSDKELSKKLRGRIGAEYYRRSRELNKLPRLRISKSKGKRKHEREVRQNRKKAGLDSKGTSK